MTATEPTNVDEYNGWPNRETWAASLHLSNDFGLYEMVNGWANDARREAMGTEAVSKGWTTLEMRTVSELADMLRDYFETLRSELMESQGGATKTERMMLLEVGSLWRIDWRELAENWLEGFEFSDDA